MNQRSEDQELRRFPRMASEQMFTYRRPGDGPEKVCRALTRVVGLGGLMFESENPPPLGGEYLLTLVIGNRTLEIASRVAYVLTIPHGWHQVGMEFQRLPEADREHLLAHFMRENYRIELESP